MDIILRDLLLFTASFGILLFFFVRREHESILINPDLEGSFLEKIYWFVQKMALGLCGIIIITLPIKYYFQAFPETPEEAVAREQRVAESKIRKAEELQNEFNAIYWPAVNSESVDFEDIAVAWAQETSLQHTANKNKYEGKTLMLRGYIKDIRRYGSGLNEFNWAEYRLELNPVSLAYGEIGLLDTVLTVKATCMIPNNEEDKLVALKINDGINITGRVTSYSTSIKMTDCFIVRASSYTYDDLLAHRRELD